MSDRNDEVQYSFDHDVPPRPSDRSKTAQPKRSTRSVRRARGTYQQHSFSSWLNRLRRTLTFRPGVYTEMMGDRHATWQASATWILASVGPAFSILVFEGPLFTGVAQVFIASVITLVLWTGVVHIASRILSKRNAHSYGQTLRSLGFSMVPGLGFLFTPFIGFTFWGLAMQVHGLKEGIGLTWPRAIIAALIPWLIWIGLVFLMLVWACAVGAC